jgi:lipopolysaccharide transport system permease protein
MTPPGYEITLRPDRRWFSVELSGIWHYRDLLLVFVWRDFVAKYKQTILGPLWFILQPLLMTAVFTVVFGKIASLPTDGLPPLLFYLCGQLGWNYFAQNITTSSATLVDNAAIFSKVYFPRLVVPVAALFSNVFAFIVQAITFVVFYFYFRSILHVGSFGLTRYALLLPLLVAHAAILSLGVSLVMSALTAKYRDLTHLTALLIQVWMYATPVIYPLRSVPPKWHWLFTLNPLTAVVESFRLMLLGAGTVTADDLAWSVGSGVFLVALGLLLFGHVEKTFVDTV